VVSAGLGGMGGAQPLAAKIAGAVFLGADIDGSRVQKRLDSKYLDKATDDLEEALRWALEAKAKKTPLSIGVECDAITLLEFLKKKNKSTVNLYTGGAKEIDKFQLVPTTSTTLMTIIGDILVVELMDKINFTKEQYQLLHHSGYISEQLKNK
jgi:urocanate hydratase